MNDSKCKFCDGSTAYILRVYNNHAKKTKIDPKWLPHIYSRCVTCGRDQRGALKQTEDLRQKIDGLTLIPYNFDEVLVERLGHIQAKIPDET